MAFLQHKPAHSCHTWRTWKSFECFSFLLFSMLLCTISSFIGLPIFEAYHPYSFNLFSHVFQISDFRFSESEHLWFSLPDGLQLIHISLWNTTSRSRFKYFSEDFLNVKHCGQVIHILQMILPFNHLKMMHGVGFFAIRYYLFITYDIIITHVWWRITHEVAQLTQSQNNKAWKEPLQVSSNPQVPVPCQIRPNSS